jgi:ribonuclease P protein component
VTKKAHERNRVKRQVREMIRLNLAKIEKGHSIIVTVRQPALIADYTVMEKELISSFKKLGIIANEKVTKDN